MLDGFGILRETEPVNGMSPLDHSGIGIDFIVRERYLFKFYKRLDSGVSFVEPVTVEVYEGPLVPGSFRAAIVFYNSLQAPG